MARKTKIRKTKTRIQMGTRVVTLPSPMAYPSPGNITCSSPSTRSSQQALNSFYTLMVKRSRGDWGFASTIYGEHLVVSHHPQQMFTSPSDALRELWKASVLNQAIRYDESVDPTSLKVVKVNMDITDTTDELFRNKQEREDYAKIAAVAKLSVEEARMLKVMNAKALQRLHQGTMTEAQASLIVQDTKNEGAEFAPGTLLRTRR